MNGRRIALLILLVWSFLALTAQRAAAQAETGLPPFSMTLANGTYFHASQLPKGKPVLLIYFDPECDHCHTLMNAFFKRAADFKSAEVLMITYKPLNDVQRFVQAYQVHKYTNIKAGTEGTTYFLRNHYRMQNTPFVALYNKEGKMTAGYQKDVPLEALHRQLKKG
jgi:cytochrome oxidase Cu insertion factor (SCO1/SenC/PrrC family)